MLSLIGFVLSSVGVVTSVVWTMSVFDIIGAPTEVYMWYWISISSIILGALAGSANR